ncbi:glycosyltransferase [Glycocaulis profundi]|nr:glycosyltransferase [Glycocaulis profundi]
MRDGLESAAAGARPDQDCHADQAEALHDALAGAAAWGAANHLLHTRSEASAAAPERLHPALWAGPLVFAAGCALLAPGATMLAAFLLLGLGFGALAMMRLASALLPVRWSLRAALDDDALPPATVIAALHDEAAVVGGLVEKLRRLDYPAERLEIVLAIESHDHATLEAAREAAATPGPAIQVLAVPPVGPTTKPKALNFALAFSSGAIIAVYDAEDAPARGQLRAAAEAFAADPSLACVQAPLNWYNDDETWLTRMFALEYAAQFNALLPLFLRLGWPLPLGGTSNVFRRDALEASGGWDPHNVTEDADLGFRLARDGWRAGLIEPGTLEEAPVTLDAWNAQRSRWLKGHAISFGVQMRDPAGLISGAGRGAMAALWLSLGANVASAAAHLPAALWITAALALGIAHPALLLGPALAGYGAGITAAWAGARRAGLRPRARDLAALPVYWLLQARPLLRALRELRGRPYLWAKTRHGVTAGARTAPDEHDADTAAHGSDGQPVRSVRLVQRTAVEPAQRPAHDPVDADRPSDGGLLPDPARPFLQLLRDRDRPAHAPQMKAMTVSTAKMPANSPIMPQRTGRDSRRHQATMVSPKKNRTTAIDR